MDESVSRKLGLELLDACRLKKHSIGRIRDLLRMGADPNARSDFDDTPLHWAVMKKSGAILDLIAAGADPNARNNQGDTPLMIATSASVLSKSDTSTVRILLDSGADPNIHASGDAPLHSAIRLGRADVCELLLADGAKVDVERKVPLESDGGCSTPLELAVGWGYSGICEILARAGADLDRRCHGDVTLLSLATINREKDVVRFLIGKGADPNLADAHGRTALHHAVLHDCPGICRLLLDAGADPTIRDANGMTPAESSGRRRRI